VQQLGYNVKKFQSLMIILLQKSVRYNRVWLKFWFAVNVEKLHMIKAYTPNVGR